jgi:hypothetical protein
MKYRKKGGKEMNKKLVGILVCMLVVFPSLSLMALANPSDTPTYYIGLAGDKLDKEIIVAVYNFKDTTQMNVPWSIEFQRFPGSSPYALKKIQGTIPQIASHETVFLKSGPVFGYMRQSIVNVTIGDQNAIAGWKNIMGPFVLEPKFRPYTNPVYQDLYYSDFIARFVSNDTGSEIKVQVTNVGNTVREKVSWFIGINQWYVLWKKRFYQHEQGTIEHLGPGESVTISLRLLENQTGFYPWSYIQVSIDGYGAAFDHRHVIGSQIIKPKYLPND